MHQRDHDRRGEQDLRHTIALGVNSRPADPAGRIATAEDRGEPDHGRKAEQGIGQDDDHLPSAKARDGEPHTNGRTNQQRNDAGSQADPQRQCDNAEQFRVSAADQGQSGIDGLSEVVHPARRRCAGSRSSTSSGGWQSLTPFGVIAIGRLIRMGRAIINWGESHRPTVGRRPACAKSYTEVFSGSMPNSAPETGSRKCPLVVDERTWVDIKRSLASSGRSPAGRSEMHRCSGCEPPRNSRTRP